MSKPTQTKPQKPTEVKVDDSIQSFMKDLYDVNSISNEELSYMMDHFMYKGFNREQVLKQIHQVIKDPKIAMQIVVAVAIAGPKRASNLRMSNGLTPNQMNIPSSGGKGNDKITLSKILAATADLAAFFLKKMNVPKRIQVECPGWLQFPSAGSIKLPDELRSQHIEFARKFSPLIKGSFDENIYYQMQTNSYLDPTLGLFS
jgi:hypothetical protein